MMLKSLLEPPSLGPAIRHSRSAKSDYLWGLWRKDGTEGPSVTSSPFSPVRFADELSRNTAVFRLIRREEAGFLCSPDCVAEGEGFEPSVRFCRAKPRPLRKLQIAKAQQRISRKTCPQKPCHQSGFDSLSIRNQANARRFWG
jgi:hypothetical protein